MKIFFWSLTIVLLLLIVIPAGVITFSGMKDNKAKADIGVVLGTTVYENGQISYFLKSRLDEAAKLYQEGYFSLIMTSGGIGNGQDEAVVMARYLEQKGVPKDKIIIDSLGNNTDATAKNLKAIMDRRGLKSAFIVTQFFHIPRTELALSCAGVETVYSSYAHNWSIRDVYSTLREIPAYGLYWLRC